MQRLERLLNQRNRQKGGLTVFTAIMVLVLLTMMIFYAARVGLFEQRVSANEVRQKTAFNAAEAAIDQGVEYLLANKPLLLSSGVAAFPGGTGSARDGWGVSKWTKCDTNVTDPTHPCGGNPAMSPESYFYDDESTGYGIFDVVIPGEAEGVTARLTANMCKVGLASPGTCLGLNEDTGRGTYMIITLLGYGFSDCEDITDVSTCNGKATVAKPLGNFSSLAGVPTVPLVTKTVFPPTGSALVVPNPNGGGEGVPISAWVNDNSGYTDPITGDTCDQDADAVLSSGSWNTCELQEWYERESVPANVACDQQSGCECTEDESLSYNHARQVLGIDIVKDSSFPCDLFHTFFNVKRVDYEFIKSTAQQLDDCSTLDDTSSGMYWVSGDSCHLGAEVVGSPGNPVVIVSAAASTSMNANFELYGLLYIFDGEVETAEFSGAGGATIYGALIVDAPTMKGFAGTINIVYARGVLLEAANIGGLGSINGGWRDFGLPEIDW